MGRRRTGVNKVRDIIRYSHTSELSERHIARALGISRTVVARTLQAFHVSGLSHSEVDQIADSLLLKSLEQGHIAQDGTRYKELSALFPEMVVELKKKGVTLQWLWEGYMREHPRGYQYIQYCLHFHRWRRSEEVSMHIEYKAGEAMLVDWAGDKLEVIDGNSGHTWALETFVAILGASGKALLVGTHSYTRIKNILALRLEEHSQPRLDLGVLPEHENVRGSGYYN
jgi:hypothetical protein